MTRDFFLEHDRPPGPTGWWTNPRLSRPHRGMAWLWRIWLTLWIIAGVIIGLGVVGRATIVGASGGQEVVKLRQHVPGLATHSYGTLEGTPVTDARYVNIEPDVSWASIAAGHSDTDLARWATALAGKHRMVSFSHEPMVDLHRLGTAADFKQAWRHVVAYFNRHHATKVTWVWNVTQNSLERDPSDPLQVDHWWPGSRYVDAVSAEAYNFNGCRHGSNTDTWYSFKAKVRPGVAYANSKGKPYVVGEFATVAKGRAKWLNKAAAYVHRHPAVIAAFYFQSPRPVGSCEWRLTTEPEYKALRGMQ